MENSLKVYSGVIALQTLLIKALKFRTNMTDFFEWSGGWKTPIYTDQRLHLGYHESVELILGALKLKVQSLETHFDGILGTKISGIPWAVLLADALKLPVIVTRDDKAFTFDYPSTIPSHEDCDLIASSSPLGIPLGIRTAYTHKKGFVYVRNKKAHGISSKVVGAYAKGQSACYLSQEGTSENPTLDMMSLMSSGLSVIHGDDDNYTTKLIDIKGMNLLALEDTISSGKSSVAEIIHARNMGAFINTTLALFSYEFILADYTFRQEDIRYYDLYSYSDLMNNAREQGYISEDDFAVIRDWYENPIAWSNIHAGTNFPL